MSADGVALTLDIDWAPDFMIEAAAETLVERSVSATWFVTHSSPAIEGLREHPELFELGIHPNFPPDSTQGDSPREVLSHCLDLVPGAISMRTHSLKQSTPLLDQVIERTEVRNDVSLLLPHTPGLQPVEHWSTSGSLLRIPFFWEDDLETARPEPVWDLEPLLAIGPGLKVFDFHPVHLFLNSSRLEPYEELKRSAPDLGGIERAAAERLVQDGPGARSLFDEVVVHLAGAGGGRRISDLADEWSVNGGSG